MSRIPAVKFLLLNGVGALVWSMAVGTGGYLFGSALEILIGNTKHYEVEVFGAIVVIGVLIWIVYFFVRRSGKKPATRSS
jgi:membrane protein DedA with SNARE-associated domain